MSHIPRVSIHPDIILDVSFRIGQHLHHKEVP